MRISPDADQRILSLINVTDQLEGLVVGADDLGVQVTVWRDLVGEGEWRAEDGRLRMELEPYQVVWLTPGG